MPMPEKTFTQMDDGEIWKDFRASEILAKKSSAGYARLAKALDRMTSDEPWCCEQMRKTPRIRFKNGTEMRVHFCPRCGREL